VKVLSKSFVSLILNKPTVSIMHVDTLVDMVIES